MNISNLIIEVTRKCNMKCAHCMRGSAQSINIDKKYITAILKQVNEISSITFTGGEPSLNVDAIEFFISEAKRLRVEIGSFYIVTNGKNIKPDFIIACLKLYAMSYEKDMCTIDLSNDIYHHESGGYNDELLKGLSFFNKRNDNDYARYTLLNEGRAKASGKGSRNLENEVSDIEDIDGLNDAQVYLNVLGDMVNGCDWSYTNQKKHVLCHVSKFKEYYNTLESGINIYE